MSPQVGEVNADPRSEESEVMARGISGKRGDRNGKTGLSHTTADISSSSCCMAIKSSTWV